MVAKLSVNLNAVALLRNRRDLPWPSVTGLGRIALEAGAHGLTVHPRPDERHTRFSDLPELRALIDDEFPQTEFNMEGFPEESFLKLCEANQPEQVTLVPDDPAQATSDHGWDFEGQGNFLRDCVQRMKSHGFRVSLFCDPDATRSSLQAAADTGADRIELYTGPYGACYDDATKAELALEDMARTSKWAEELGLEINAGHDLTVANLPALVKAIPNLAEVSIGNGLTADCLEFGMEKSVKRFLEALGS